MVLCDYTKGEKTSISLLHFRAGVIVSVTFKEVYNTPKGYTAADKADYGLEYGAGSSNEGRSINFSCACCECLCSTGAHHNACDSRKHCCLLSTTGELRELLVLRLSGRSCLHCGNIDRSNIQFVHR